ncbi:DUF11 domain-containing protein [Ruminococcaceae bacterium OttesenSCG-928-A16]|nr:DUF11 domain-containing protein [Ruminococcaceae bacterium OttesenSCG-928-A16]
MKPNNTKRGKLRKPMAFTLAAALLLTVFFAVPGTAATAEEVVNSSLLQQEATHTQADAQQIEAALPEEATLPEIVAGPEGEAPEMAENLFRPLATGTEYEFTLEPAVPGGVVPIGIEHTFSSMGQYTSVPEMEPEDAPLYRVALLAVAPPADGTYTDTTGEESFTPTYADEGLVYNATYIVQTTEDDGETWVDVEGTETEIAFTVQEQTYLLSLLGMVNNQMKYDTEFEFLLGVSVDVSPQAVGGVQFAPYVVGVQTPTGGLYVWAEGDTAFTPESADIGKDYVITYGVRKSIDDGATWQEVPDVEGTRTVSVASTNMVLDEITSDNVRVKDLKIDITDGTPGWDANDNPGNDSAFNNKIVRSFDGVLYNLTFTTESANKAEYKHGRLYFEATLPVTKDKATFDTNAMGLMDVTPEYMWQLVEENGTQTLKWYYELNTTTNDTDDEIYPFPNQGTFPVHVLVKAMNNGEELIPTFTASVAYTENDEIKTSGTYDTPAEKAADPVKVSAAPNYNIELRKASDSHVGAIDVFDFGTGDSTALNKDAGKVYGRLQGYSVALQLYNQNKNKGLKGIELPSGDVTFDVDLSAQFVGSNVPNTNYGQVKSPLVWAYGGSTECITLNGRDISKYGYTYLPNTSAFEAKNTGEFQATPPDNFVQTVWNGGNWSAVQNNGTLSVTVKDYIVNPLWFPSGGKGSDAATKYYYDWETEGVQNIGTFSVGALYFVVPFGGETGRADEEYYPNKYGESSGSVQTVVQATNLKMESVTGEPFTTDMQENRSDDKLETSVTLLVGGNYINYCMYNNPAKWAATGLDGVREGEDFHAGTDSQMVGGKLAIGYGSSNRAEGDLENSATATNLLLKFDDKALEIDKDSQLEYHPNTAIMVVPESITHLYAAKLDGNGWVSDAEMGMTNEKDLVYYATLDELEEAGKTCVGILSEVRLPKDAADYAVHQFWIRAFFHVKNDTSLAGGTYMTTSVNNVWRRPEYLAYLEENGGTFPSRLDMAAGEDHAVEPTIKDNKRSYGKAIYDDTGYHPVTGGEPYWGDTLYVVPYKATITKQVEQKDGAGAQKLNYDLGQGQTVADFVLNPALVVGGSGESDFTTDITIQDTLPAGTTYKTGSATLGGTYTANANPGLPGTVTGGQELEPEINFEADGSQVLTWLLQNHSLTSPVPAIRYKVDIDMSTTAGTVYLNTATISTTEDLRVHKGENSNLATAKIQINVPALLVLKKRPDKIFIDPNELIGYTLDWTNNAANAYNNIVLMDSMPMAGDTRGSQYTGSHTVEELKITFPAGKTNANYAFYYSLNPETAELTSEDLTYTDFAGDTCTVLEYTWQKAEIAPDGTITGANGKELAAWVILGNLTSKETLKVHITIQPHENSPGDKYVNAISAGGVSSSATVYTIDRQVAGTVWLDTNYNGRRDAGEKLFGGVTATLLTLNDAGEWVTPKTASGVEIAPVITNAQGAYFFGNLPAGEFKVVFSSTEGGCDLCEYKTTLHKADGVPGSLNSKAEGLYREEDGLLHQGEITTITMPQAAEMATSPHVVRYQDMGLIELAIPDKDYNTPDIENGDIVRVGDIIPYKITYGNDDTVRSSTVTIVDVIDKGLTVVQNSISDNGVFTPDETGATGGTITWVLEDVAPLTYNGFVSFNTVVNENAGFAVQVLNQATVTYKYNNSAQPEKTYPVGPLKNPLSPDDLGMVVVKSATPASGSKVTVGDTVTYSLAIKNTGNATIPFGVVRDYIPLGTTYTPGSVSNNAKSAGVYAPPPGPEGAGATPQSTRAYVEWVVEDLAVGEERILTFAVTVNQGAPATITNVALYNSTPQNPGTPGTIETEPEIPTNEVEHIYEPIVGLSVLKSSTPESGTIVPLGSNITYNVSLQNTGNEDLPYTVVRDYIPENTTYVPGSASSTANTPGAFVEATAETPAYVEWVVQNLAVGETREVSFEVTVNQNAAGAINNTALYGLAPEDPGAPGTITTEPANPTNQVVHPIPVPGLSVTKSSNPESGAAVEPGSDIIYSITLQNTGNVAIPYTVVRDYIPHNTTYVLGSVSSTANTPGTFVEATAQTRAYVEWVVQNLAVGETRTVHFEVTVKQDATTAINNTALYGLAPENPGAPGTITTEPALPTNEVVHPLPVPIAPEELPTAGSGNQPVTGDTNQIGLAICLLVISAIIIAVITTHKKRKAKGRR